MWVGLLKIRDFRPISGYSWQTIQDRVTVTMEINRINRNISDDRESYLKAISITYLLLLLCVRDLLAIANFLVVSSYVRRTLQQWYLPLKVNI